MGIATHCFSNKSASLAKGRVNMNDLEAKIKKIWIQTINKRLKELSKLTKNCGLCNHLKTDCSKCPIDADSNEPLLTFSCEEYCSMIEKIQCFLDEQLQKLGGNP